MSDLEIRRQVLLDRLEGVMVDAERYKSDAIDAGDFAEAAHWYVLAAAVRSTIVMLNTLEEA